MIGLDAAGRVGGGGEQSDGDELVGNGEFAGHGGLLEAGAEALKRGRPGRARP